MGPFELTRKILREEGVKGLFRGLGSTIVREMPGYFLFFGGYEGTRTLLTPEGQTKDDIGKVCHFVSSKIFSRGLYIGAYWRNLLGIIRSVGRKLSDLLKSQI